MAYDHTKSPVGWYIASIMERLEPIESKNISPKSRALVWENTHIIQANSAEEAYEKAFKIGELSNQSSESIDKYGRRCKWKFMGISDLVPIYDKLEDGAEILWAEHGYISAKRVMRNVYSKNEIIEMMKNGQVNTK